MMRRFETPPAPPGWTGGGATLIRIVDPLGGAIAWIAPDYGGACVGYAIRRDDDGTHWYQILRASGPRDWRADSLSAGIAILGPDADDLTAASQTQWQFIERDPTAATCATQIDGTTLLFTARLEGSALHLNLRAERAERPQRSTLGLRLTFAGDLSWDGDSNAGPNLHTADDRLHLTLIAPEQESARWAIDETATGVTAGIIGQDSVTVILRYAE